MVEVVGKWWKVVWKAIKGNEITHLSHIKIDTTPNGRFSFQLCYERLIVYHDFFIYYILSVFSALKNEL